MPDNQLVTAYGHVNCALCYALNERLSVYAPDYRLHWMTADGALYHAKQSGHSCIRVA